MQDLFFVQRDDQVPYLQFGYKLLQLQTFFSLLFPVLFQTGIKSLYDFAKHQKYQHRNQQKQSGITCCKGAVTVLQVGNHDYRKGSDIAPTNKQGKKILTE